MSSIEQARNSLLDFSALGSKLHDLLKTEEQIRQLTQVESDIKAIAPYQQEVAILTDQIRRLRNSLSHSPLEDVMKQIALPQESTQEAVMRWDSISRSIRETVDATEAIRRLNEATKALSESTMSSELAKAMDQVNEVQKMSDALRGLDDAKKMNEMMRGVDEMKNISDLMEQLKKLK